MKINLTLLRSALHEWSSGITQFTATQRITKSYFELGLSTPSELHQIEFLDGTVDHDAWRNNNQNIFHRWRKCRTEVQREKFAALSPAILHAMDPEIRAMVTAGNSIEFLTSRLLKEHADVVNAALLNAPLPDNATLLDALEPFAPDPQNRKMALISAGFPWARHGQTVSTLSGGERSRLLFVGLTLARYSLLMLDEPTNHLDMEGKEALAQTLQQFEGGVLLVSHDRQLISQSCNRFWLIENGTLSEWHDAEAVFERLREGAGLLTSAIPAAAATVQPSPYDDLLERLVALETLLEDDLARKPKHQKPQLQAQWRKEIKEIEAQL